MTRVSLLALMTAGLTACLADEPLQPTGNSRSLAQHAPWSGALSSTAAGAVMIELNFTSLPSQQGWTYVPYRGGPESEVFSIDNGVLVQNSILSGGAPVYLRRDVVAPTGSACVEVRARVLEENPAGGVYPGFLNTFGFGFGFYLGTAFAGFADQAFAIGIGDTFIHDVIQARPLDLPAGFSTREFHTYLLEATPGVGYRLLIDGAFVAAGPPRGLNLTEFEAPQRNSLILGDFTFGTSARAEVAGYRFRQPCSTDLEVSIDIKPGSSENPVNPGTPGEIPVAILTAGGFGATAVDALSVRFGPAGAAETHGRGHIEDVDRNGEADLVLHFRADQTGIRCGDASAVLTGRTMRGQSIRGSDSVRTVGCR